MNLQHISLIFVLIILFLFILSVFLCFDAFFYFRFIRLPNASSFFVITFSFNDFFHELNFLFRDANWYKYFGRAAIGLLWNVSMSSSVFYLTKCFRCILYSSLLLLITLFLLFTMQLCDKNLARVVFLSLCVDSINIKGKLLQRAHLYT